MNKMGNSQQFEKVLEDCGFDYNYADILNIIAVHTFQLSDKWEEQGYPELSEMCATRGSKLFDYLDSIGHFNKY